MCQNGRPGLTLLLPQQESIRIFLPPICSSQLCTRELDLAGFGLVVVRRQPVLVLGHMRIGQIRKDVPQRIARQIGFLDPRDGGFADGEHWHSPTIFSAGIRW